MCVPTLKSEGELKFMFYAHNAGIQNESSESKCQFKELHSCW